MSLKTHLDKLRPVINWTNCQRTQQLESDCNLYFIIIQSSQILTKIVHIGSDAFKNNPITKHSFIKAEFAFFKAFWQTRKISDCSKNTDDELQFFLQFVCMMNSRALNVCSDRMWSENLSHNVQNLHIYEADSQSWCQSRIHIYFSLKLWWRFNIPEDQTSISCNIKPSNITMI